MDHEQAKFEGWATVELLGHRTERGYVTTQYFGSEPMFHIDTPEVPERDVVLCDGGVFGSRWIGVGSTVRKSRVPGKDVLVGMKSVYAINPCSEQDVIAGIGEQSPIKEIVTLVENGEEIPF